MSIRVEPLELPLSTDENSRRGDEFRKTVRLIDASNSALLGSGNQSVTPATVLSALQGQASERVESISAYRDEALVGHAEFFLPTSESTDIVDTLLLVHPDVQGRARQETFEALVQASLDRAGQLGRTTIFGGGVGVREGDITATTGYGGVMRDDPESVAWIRRGASLSQVYRYSRLDLDSLTDIDTRLGQAEQRSDGYRVVTWEGETPASYRADMRTLHERMSTDSPTGDLELEPETWSDERLAEFERFKIGSERRMFAAAVQHEESGQLVGYSQLVIAGDPCARQHNLIVLREHRGHGLGQLLKLAGIAQLRDNVPHADRITTMNAEENRHMIRVNEAVGFEVVTWTVVWQLRLDVESQVSGGTT
ncbi:GNAT family N-acetyltransferase [uncultured Agrococcus sp.]|uniref:GNAT family N-acetyltransferase n=1 Tax=uncultured Agrococcus sp. TaxID=382258 RepID=UPI0025DD37E9|nr:GNAT family N-acetyltransferase [uncultured Agrococcus sp.]